MKTFISMLRGINVSGQKRITMPELIALYETLGFSNVITYVQSGNVVFTCAEIDPGRVSAQIEAGIQAAFGYTLPVFVRDVQDFQRLVAGNPFLKDRSEDPARLHVTFLYRAPAEARLGKLAALTGDGDEFVLGQDEVFLFCPNGYGRTKLSNNTFENKLKVSATTRNWNTVLALLRLAEGI